MAEYQFKAGDIIFHEGDDAEHAFFILEGEVELVRGVGKTAIRVMTMKPGEVFGKMALFEVTSKRSTTSRALTDMRVDVLDKEEFLSLINQCPPRILPLIHGMLDRLRSNNARPTTPVEQTMVTLGSEIERIIVKPASDALKFVPLVAPVARLPFRIGSLGADGSNVKNRQNHLNLPYFGLPMLVSRQHCQVEIIESGLWLVDMGSRYTTVVNGHNIGRGKGKYRFPLKKGENEIILGGLDSPYKILMVCE